MIRSRVVAVPPPGLPVELATIKRQLRLPDGDNSQDGTLRRHLQASVEQLEEDTSGYFRTANTPVVEHLDQFPLAYQAYSLKRWPVRNFVAIKYDDHNGDEQTLPAEEYSADLTGPPARLLVLCRPSVSAEILAPVRLEYEAGFQFLPAVAIEAIHRDVADRFLNGGLYSPGDHWQYAIRQLQWGPL